MTLEKIDSFIHHIILLIFLIVLLVLNIESATYKIDYTKFSLEEKLRSFGAYMNTLFLYKHTYIKKAYLRAKHTHTHPLLHLK